MGVIVAVSAAGSAFEWCDFSIFGSLASLISKNLLAGVSEIAGFILALGAFGTRFAFRPRGSLVLGWVGDKLGREGAFVITVAGPQVGRIPACGRPAPLRTNGSCNGDDCFRVFRERAER